MSSLVELLSQQISGQALSNLSQQLGTDENQVSSAISAALPMIVGAMARNASSEDGAKSLFNALQKDHDGSILENLSGFLGSADNGPGPGILKHVFGEKREMIEKGVSQMSGLNTSTAGSLLENLAPIVMGQLGRMQQSRGLDAGGLASILLGERQQQSQAGGTAAAAISMLTNVLDQDNDGSFLDDLGGMLGGFMKR